MNVWSCLPVRPTDSSWPKRTYGPGVKGSCSANDSRVWETWKWHRCLETTFFWRMPGRSPRKYRHCEGDPRGGPVWQGLYSTSQARFGDQDRVDGPSVSGKGCRQATYRVGSQAWPFDSCPVGTGVRPTSDLVREAVFDVVGSVVGLGVLDLFAGSGAMGLEALSRGARFVRLRRH